MNSAVGRVQGVTDEQLTDLSAFEASPRFDTKERAALRYAEGMTRTPAKVADNVSEKVRKYFTTAQIVGPTGAVALENFRSRFNRALNIESDGFCELPSDHPVQNAISRGVPS